MTGPALEAQTGESPPDLWDPLVRLSHWGLALIVLGNEALTRGGSVWHIWIGWGGLALLVLRLVWGLIGPRAARFVAFPPNPRAAIAHLRELADGKPRHYASHNPAGALMVYTLWAALAIVIATGVMMTGPNPVQAAADRTAAEQRAAEQAAVAAQATAPQVNPDGTVAVAPAKPRRIHQQGLTRDLHSLMANLIVFLVSLHVAGVFVEGTVMRRNLLAPMLLGLRPKNRPPRAKHRR